MHKYCLYNFIIGKRNPQNSNNLLTVPPHFFKRTFHTIFIFYIYFGAFRCFF
jgi:hypothetical protein